MRHPNTACKRGIAPRAPPPSQSSYASGDTFSWIVGRSPELSSSVVWHRALLRLRLAHGRDPSLRTRGREGYERAWCTAAHQEANIPKLEARLRASFAGAEHRGQCDRAGRARTDPRKQAQGHLPHRAARSINPSALHEEAVAAQPRRRGLREESGKSKLVQTRSEVERRWRAVDEVGVQVASTAALNG